MRKISFEDTKVSKVGKNATLLSISKIMNLTISMITSMLLARFRTLHEYGTFSEISTVVSIAIAVICIGLPSCLNYFVPRCNNQKERDEFISFYYLINTGLGVLTGIVLLCATPFIAAYYNNAQIITYSYALVLLPLGIIMHKSRDNLLVATNQCTRAIVYNVAQTVSNLLIILLTQWLNRPFSFYFLLYIIDNIVFACLVYLEASRLVTKTQFRLSKGLIKEILTYSLPLGVSSAVATIALDLDKLIIGWLFDTEKVAIYTNCGKELPIVYIATSFSAVLLPVVVRNIKNKNNVYAVELWKKTVEFSMLIVAFFTGACIAFAPQMITILYSTKYLDGVAIFRIYALVLLFRVTSFAMMLNALGKTKTIMLNSVIALVVNAILNYILYMIIGFEGPALSTLLTLGLNCMFLLKMSSRYISFRFKDIFPWGRLGQILAVNTLGSLACYAVLNILNIGTTTKDVIFAIGIGIVWTAMYALIYRKRFVILWKEMNKEETRISAKS